MEVDETEPGRREQIVLQNLPVGHDHAEVDLVRPEFRRVLWPQPLGLAHQVTLRPRPSSDRVGLDFLPTPRGPVRLRIHRDNRHPG